MTTILVTTPSDPTANAYIDLADANAYHALRMNNAEWDAASDLVKEKHIAWATRLLDMLDYTGFLGETDYQGYQLSNTGQVLRWPRSWVVDPDGRQLSSTEIPKFLAEATAEFAFQLMKEDWSQGLGSKVAQGDTKVGELTTPIQAHNRIPPSVQVMINPYLKANVNSNGVGTYGSAAPSKGGIKTLVRS